MNQKTRKNIVLTVLACLNCVHTTHAVEKTPVEMHNIGQDNGQESLGKLKAQATLQNLRMVVGMATGNPDRDAAIQREEIMQKVYAHKKDARSPDDWLQSLYEGLIGISREIVEDLRNLPDDSEFLPANLTTRLENKIKEWVDFGKIKGLEEDIGMGYVSALLGVDPDLLYFSGCGMVPTLDLVFKPVTDHVITYNLTNCDQYTHELKKEYPDIAQQRRDLYRKFWVHEVGLALNSHDEIANIGARIQRLDESNTETGREMKETLLNTIRENLLGENQDLKEKTETLLAKNPELRQELESQIGRMTLVKIMEHKKQTQSPLNRVQKGPFREIIKY